MLGRVGTIVGSWSSSTACTLEDSPRSTILRDRGIPDLFIPLLFSDARSLVDRARVGDEGPEERRGVEGYDACTEVDEVMDGAFTGKEG